MTAPAAPATSSRARARFLSLGRAAAAFAFLAALSFANGARVSPDTGPAFVAFGIGAALLVAARGLHPRLGLLLPAAASSLALAFAPVPILGASFLLQWVGWTVLAIVLADDLETPIVLGGIAAAGLAGALVVLAECAASAARIGSAGWGAGASGLMGGANISGIVIAAAIPAVSALARRTGRGTSAAAAAILLLAVGVAGTGSRTALLALAAAVAWAALGWPGPVRRWLFLGVLVAVALFAAAYLPRALDRLDPGYITNLQRASMIRGTFEAFAASPWLGHGPWSFPVLGQAWLSWPKWELHPHSLPLRVLFESGLAGALAWVLLVLAAVRSFAREAGAAEWTQRLASRPAAGIALVLVAGSWTDDPFWIPGPAILGLAAFGSLLPAVAMVRPRARAAWMALAVFAAFLAAPPGAGVMRWAPGIEVPDPVALVDRAVRDGIEPGFRGADREPNALRARAWIRWNRGDTAGCLGDLLRAAQADPGMIWGPRFLDLAWFSEATGDSAAAAAWIARARSMAPVLTARYLGETASVGPSPLDWHYGIEHVAAGRVEPDDIPGWGDPLDWKHWRGRAARRLEQGDTAGAWPLLAVARTLAARQYGRDPALARLELLAGPPPSIPPSGVERWRAVREDEIAARDGASYPWRIYAGLAFRRLPSTGGENSPWWDDRCAPRDRRERAGAP